jgi:hypothetical protein
VGQKKLDFLLLDITTTLGRPGGKEVTRSSSLYTAPPPFLQRDPETQLIIFPPVKYFIFYLEFSP